MPRACRVIVLPAACGSSPAPPVAVVVSTVFYHFLTLWVRPPDTTAALFFSSSFTLVIGFYFGRTNHQRTGGIGGGTVEDSR